MIKQNIFIINFNSLYEILDEIKENLSFKIIKFENEDDLKKKHNLDIIDYLVISKTDHKLLLNNNITDKNFLDFNDLPLSLKKLLELINIKLIKLKFNNQSKIIIKGYELNFNSKFFSKGNLNLKLTEKEIEIILYLINQKLNIMWQIYKKIYGTTQPTWKPILLKHIFIDYEKNNRSI